MNIKHTASTEAVRRGYIEWVDNMAKSKHNTNNEIDKGVASRLLTTSSQYFSEENLNSDLFFRPRWLRTIFTDSGACPV